jgi:shikimate kinase/3-dehydroquinate synthase
VVVYLDVDSESAWHRCGGSRPLARDRHRFEQLHEERRPLYEAVADAWLPAAERSTIRTALPALAALARSAPRPKLLWGSSTSGHYPVFFGHGLVASGFFHPRDGRRFVLSDQAVAAFHPVAGDWSHAIPPGEPSKTPAQAAEILRAMASAGVTRSDILAAVGGGVVGDIGGLCAALYQRGMRWVGVPTTLVAQVDSAYGGKTGVDLAEAKNYVGSYHEPSAVIADTDTLVTLPDAEVAAGYAEVVKTALIAGGSLWRQVRAGADPSDPGVITACVRTKLGIVARDYRDGGLRQVLNLGHTVGHAIETVTGYARYRHGEAVALGLLAALRLSEREDLREEVRELLAARGLPTVLEDADPDAVVMATARDKKRVGEGPVPFVLLEEPGAARPGCAVEPRALIAAVRELAHS